MIEAKKLTRCYGEFRAVDRLSFTVEAGTVLGFLGPNGAGKSTTMKMLTGFLPPTSGSASIHGHDIVADSLAARRLIGYLPEGAPLYGELSVLRFLEFVAGARGYRGTEAMRRVEQVIERLQLDEVWMQTIETLSKGFKRRVGLAQAIISDPPVLVLDEPTDGLDPNQKQQVRRLIREMAPDKIIIIARGKLLADDSPTSLLARSRYARAVSLACDDLQGAASALSELPEAGEVEIRRGLVTAFPSGQGDLFQAVSKLARERAWRVSRMQLEAGRLEDVFRRITRDETVEDAA